MDSVYWLNGIMKWSLQLGSLIIICISMAELINKQQFGQGSLNLARGGIYCAHIKCKRESECGS